MNIYKKQKKYVIITSVFIVLIIAISWTFYINCINVDEDEIIDDSFRREIGYDVVSINLSIVTRVSITESRLTKYDDLRKCQSNNARATMEILKEIEKTLKHPIDSWRCRDTRLIASVYDGNRVNKVVLFHGRSIKVNGMCYDKNQDLIEKLLSCH